MKDAPYKALSCYTYSLSWKPQLTGAQIKMHSFTRWGVNK